MQGLPESSKERLAEAGDLHFCGNARALVVMSELAQFKEVTEIVLPIFNKDVHKRRGSHLGEEAMTLRPEEQGSQHLFVTTSKIQRANEYRR